MTLSDIISDIEIKDETSSFHQFTNKWIQYVLYQKNSAEIIEDDWKLLFGRRNPVAGIDYGEMLDEVKISRKGLTQTNEQKSFKEGWDNGLCNQILSVMNTASEDDKINQIKDLSNQINSIIIEGGGRKRPTAINRMLTTFFPDLFIRSPHPKKLEEFIDLLHEYVDNSDTIIKADNWVDNSYRVRKFFEGELKDEKEKLSAWWAYQYLLDKKNGLEVSGNKSTNINTNISLNNSKEYDVFVKLLKSNYNLILTGAPGTGKTYLAKEIAKSMEAKWKIVQFHPSYDYTDFVEGLRPVKEGSTLGFQRKNGVFKDFCKEALESKDAFEYGYTKLVEAINNAAIDGEKYECSTLGRDKHIFELTKSSKGIVFHRSSTKKTAKKEELSKIYNFYLEKGKTDISNVGKTDMENLLGRTLDYTNWRGIVQQIFNFSADIINQPKNFVLIIDEINRGEISKIFGELFYSIDPGYRGEDGMVETQYQNLVPEDDVFSKGFFVPKNIYIIGTMNDIDKSVESMDFAMRRRFAWKEIKAEDRQSMLDDEKAWDGKKPSPEIIEQIKIRMNNLNACIIDKENIGLSKAYQIGASYFLKLNNYLDNGNATDESWKSLWENHLEGLLYEYLRGSNNIEDKIEQLYSSYKDTTKH